MKDITLTYLIDMAENADPPMEHEVTLLVDGFLVSGFLISVRKYMQGHPNTAQLAAELKKTFETLDTKIVPSDESSPIKPGEELIHLRSAQFFVPGHDSIPGTGVFLCLSLASVHGYFLGKLENQNLHNV